MKWEETPRGKWWSPGRTGDWTPEWALQCGEGGAGEGRGGGGGSGSVTLLLVCHLQDLEK